MLSSTLALHDLRDAEAFVAATISRSKHRLQLRPDELEAVSAFCIASVWRASIRHDPGLGRFSTLAGVVTQRAIVDYLRKERGRTRWVYSNRVIERTLPQLVSLDNHTSDGNRLVESLRDGESDSPPDRVTALAGLLDERGSSVAGDKALIRADVARRARRRGSGYGAARAARWNVTSLSGTTLYPS